MDGVRIRMFALFWHEGEVWAREIYTLDYGFSSAVLGFNRCAAATAFILQNLLLLPVDHYVDDFWVLVPETLLSCARFCMREGLVALGWRTAAEKSLWGCAVPLVGFLLSAANKSIRVENTEARKHEIVTEIDQVVRSAELQETPLEVLTKVVFRIAFAAQALQGRSGRHALRPLFKCLRPHWPVALHGRLPPDGEQALCLWRDWIQHAEPRSWPIHLRVREIVCLLTDASLKWNRIGGLLITSSGRWAFSAELPQDFIRAHAHTEHYVYAAELYAHMSALATMGGINERKTVVLLSGQCWCSCCPDQRLLQKVSPCGNDWVGLAFLCGSRCVAMDGVGAHFIESCGCIHTRGLAGSS